MSLLMGLSAAWLLLFGGFLAAYVALGLRDRRPGRHRHAQLAPEDLAEFQAAAAASLHRSATPTPATGVITRLAPAPAVTAEDTGPVGPFVPGIGRRLAPQTEPRGMRLEAPTSTCRTCSTGGLVAGGRCIVCGSDDAPVYRNGVH